MTSPENMSDAGGKINIENTHDPYGSEVRKIEKKN